MIRSHRFARSFPRVIAAAAALSLSAGFAVAQPGNYPITAKQRSTAQKVAQDGVPLSELAPNAPDSYTVKSGDTLWDISKLFQRSPWRWPELWGMNIDQVKNPHLIYPGQLLVLDKLGDRARLRFGNQISGGDTVRLSPRVRSSDLNVGIPAIDLAKIEPFLNEAVVFDAKELDHAPRIVASQENRVLVSRGDIAYVRGDLKGLRNFRVFREPTPLTDPVTKEVLGYEGVYLGSVEVVRRGDAPGATVSPTTDVVPDTVSVVSTRQEMRAGDRLSPVPGRDFHQHVPRAPEDPIAGHIISVYGEALIAGQNQIVSINRGSRDGLETGHVLALWRDGRRMVDRTDPRAPTIKLPDERQGMLYVFRVFNRVSYGLILSASDPIRSGDRVTQP